MNFIVHVVFAMTKCVNGMHCENNFWSFISEKKYKNKNMKKKPEEKTNTSGFFSSISIHRMNRRIAIKYSKKFCIILRHFVLSFADLIFVTPLQ